MKCANWGKDFFVNIFGSQPAGAGEKIFIYWLDPKYIFGGLLIGAAVGAGFAAFEDIWYVLGKTINATFVNNNEELVAKLLNFLNNTQNISQEKFLEAISKILKQMRYTFYSHVYNNGFDILIFRSFGTLGGHVTWAAIEGGALVMVKGTAPFVMKNFFDVRFLAYFGSAMAMHWAWNYSAVNEIQLHHLPYIGDLTYLIISIIAVFIAFSLIKKAVAQVLQVVNSSVPVQDDFSNTTMLLANSGPLTNSLFPIGQRLTFGRDPASCNVVLPSETLGVSRCHCILERTAGGVFIADVGSTAGTFLSNGQKIPQNQWVQINGEFYLGSVNVKFKVN